VAATTVQVDVLGRPQRWAVQEANQPACVLHRIPFQGLGSVRPLLDLLRQQLTFNELYASCAEPAAHGAAPMVSAAAPARLVAVEVMVTPPSRLTLVLAHPRVPDLVTVNLAVAAGGVPTLTVHPAAVAAALGAATVARLEQVCIRLRLRRRPAKRNTDGRALGGVGRT